MCQVFKNVCLYFNKRYENVYDYKYTLLIILFSLLVELPVKVKIHLLEKMADIEWVFLRNELMFLINFLSKEWKLMY